MIKNKGFTLIEMLAVVTILGIITLIAFPYANNLLKKSKDNEYQRFLDDISLATEAYLVDNSDNYESLKQIGGTDYISLKNIVESGYLKSTTINPKTNEKIDLNTSVKVTLNEDKTYNYELMNKNYDVNGYVQDGLVLMYDISSKPIISETDFIWKDLSGNDNNVTLKNFASDIESWYSNMGILFDGIDDYGLIGEHNYDNLTVSAVVQTFDMATTSDSEIVSNCENGGYALMYTKERKFYFAAYYNNDYNRAISYIGEDNIFYSLTGLFNGINTSIWVNDSSTSTSSGNFTITSPQSNTNLVIGGDPSGNSVTRGFAKMQLKHVRIYNRALTEEEINKNYEIDKVRFGL